MNFLPPKNLLSICGLKFDLNASDAELIAQAIKVMGKKATPRFGAKK